MLDETYSYDAVGNRLTDAKTGATGWTYTADDELQNYGEGSEATVLAYDANGNVISKTINGVVTHKYVYNSANRLTTVTDGNDTLIARYAYDPFGRRIKKTLLASGQSTYFVYGPEGLIGEYETTNGNAIRNYGYAPGSPFTTSPLFMKTGGQIYYYHNDHLGTPQKLVSQSGAVVWSVKYEAFGKAYVEANTVENPLRFPGQYYDGESGLHYNYFRYYDPSLGRYIQADKLDIVSRTNDPQLIALGFGNVGWFEFNGEIYYDDVTDSSVRLNHLYGYANQNPISWTDPFGLEVNYWSGTTRSDVSLGDSISDPNGNVFPGYTRQDWKCSSIACVLNPFPPMVKRCINHDKCYENNKCNASSWISNALGGTKSCNQCNSNF